ncbi:hypothetical protein [Enterovirga sp.]|uniref:hypothetical protein n=1 Tax=Enterovirga sp. TaxID=2026350 RepID=UPI002613051A|nr:hypothetical protein [Enterovirga sp.]MDB5590071.1 hypothetical protein [Enterovirga sp.]
MTALVFEHRGWTVVANTWSAAAKPGGGTALSYLAGAELGPSPNPTGFAEIELPIPIEAFLKILSRGGHVVDLRGQLPEP